MLQRISRLLMIALLPLVGCSPSPQTQTSTNAPGTAAEAKHANPRSSSGASGFDFYLLNLSWSPEFCHSHPDANECAAHATFVLHGLWPQNNDGTYPENCSNSPGPSDPAQYADIYPDQGLLQHEWRAHGTCSGLNADEFFSTARNAYHSVKIPGTLTTLSSQLSLPPEEILGLFTASNPEIPRASLALSCGNNYLTAVEVCLDKNLHPVACGTIRSCRANTVRIPPP
jgi:ribonuclease T2